MGVSPRCQWIEAFREASDVGPPLIVSATNRRRLLTKHGTGREALLRHRHVTIIIYLFSARLISSVRRKNMTGAWLSVSKVVREL